MLPIVFVCSGRFVPSFVLWSLVQVVLLLAPAPGFSQFGPLSDEFQVNSYTSGGQSDPALSIAPSGEFVVVWESAGSAGTDTDMTSIQGQHLGSSGSPVGAQFQVNTATSGF